MPPMSVARTLPYGNPKIVLVTGTADVVTLALNPGVGFFWNIVECWGIHDDTSPRSLNWKWYDYLTTLEIVKEGSGAIAAATPWHLNQRSGTTPWTTHMNPVMLQGNRIYPVLVVDALTAGKKLYIRALVYEMGDS